MDELHCNHMSNKENGTKIFLFSKERTKFHY